MMPLISSTRRHSNVLSLSHVRVSFPFSQGLMSGTFPVIPGLQRLVMFTNNYQSLVTIHAFEKLDK